MRPTLHDYVIDVYDKADTTLESCATALDYVNDFAKLTNRAPRLGDFIPCDEDGNFSEEPDSTMDYGISDSSVNDSDAYEYQSQCRAYVKAQDRVIFKGDWEVVSNEYWVVIRNKELKIDLEFNDIQCDVTDWDDQWNTRDVFEINRIEELPREIEFKEGVV